MTTRYHKFHSPLSFGGRPRGSPVNRVLIILGMLLANIGAQAQDSTGATARVHGTVVDQSGAALPRASVELRNAAGEVVASIQTNGRGEFALDLREGAYTVSATLPGFVPLLDETLQVSTTTPAVALTLRIPAVEEQIVVTATRTETPLAQEGSSATVITGEQLKQEGITTVSDALRRVAGLNLVQSGGYGQVTSLFVRGGNSDYTKVLIDGIAVNEPGGAFNFANLSTLDIDRIEVVRGPQSALFGSDAMAGVIQIFTRRGTSEGLSPSPRALVEGGTFASYRYAGGVSGRNQRMDYSASFARSDTDNAVQNGSFNEETIAADLGFSLSKNIELRAVFRSEAGRAGVPGPTAFQRADPEEYYRHRDFAGALSLTQQIGVSWKQQFAYSVRDSWQFSEDPVDSGSFMVSYQGKSAPFSGTDFAYQTLNQTRRQKANYQTDLILPYGHLLTAGADYEHESGTIGDPRHLPLEATRDNYGGYVQDQWSFRNRLFAAAGVRLEQNRSFGFFAAPRASFAVHLHQPKTGEFWGLTKIKGNFGLGIKEPTLIESYSKSPYFRGNPDLLPERSNSFDAGIEQHFGAERGMIECNYFDNRYRDQIGFVTTDYTTFEGTFFNLGKSSALGMETIIRQNLGHGFEISGAYTFLDSKVLESSNDFDPVYAKGSPLLRRPRHSGYLDLRWKPGRWTFGASGILVGRRVDSDFVGLGLMHNPGYGILNLLADFRITESISLYALGNNVLGKEYMEVLGYPALRASFRVGVRAGF